MSRVILLLTMLTGVAFASSEGGETDIVMRTINFIIFAGIMYYLLADKIKAFFQSRTQAIIDEHEKVQNRLKETKLAKQNAEKKVEEAKKIAAELLAVSKKENALLNEKIVAQMDLDIQNMENAHNTAVAFEQRNMVSEIVEEVMSDVLSNENIPLDDEMMTNIIMKKVA